MYYSYVEIEYVATSFSPARTELALKLLNSLLAGGKPDKIAIRQGWGTIVVSARTQKSRFKDLDWSSVTVMSS